jgi:hypothetical protein
MKMMVKLAVLFAILLLVTGVAFSADCDCYEVSGTALDVPATDTRFVRICFDYGDNIGEIYGLCPSLCAPPEPLFMFFDSMNEKALTSYAHGGITRCVTHFKFHGNNQNVLTGIHFNGIRWTIWGHKTDDSNCVCTP